MVAASDPSAGRIQGLYFDTPIIDTALSVNTFKPGM